MPLFNGDFFFQSAAGDGWSERWFMDVTSISVAETTLATFQADRLALLPMGDALIYQRVSTPGLPPNSLLTAVSATDGAGTYDPGIGHTALPIDNCILCTFIGNDVLKNRKFIRRITTADITDEAWTPSSGWLTAFDNMLAFLVANGFVVASHYDPGFPQVLAPLVDGDTGPRVSYRKAGRPFGLPRGRRKTRLV